MTLPLKYRLASDYASREVGYYSVRERRHAER